MSAMELQESHLPRVNALPEARREPIVWVSRHEALLRARTLMELHDFSQLPVTEKKSAGQNALPLHGAVTWESIGRALIRNPEAEFADCIITSPPTAFLYTPLFEAIEAVKLHGYVVVLKEGKLISGLITHSDLSEALVQRTKPFAYLEALEKVLRDIAKQHKIPIRDDAGEVIEVDEVPLGKVVEAVTRDDQEWVAITTQYDRKELKKALAGATALRNSLMHFREESDDNRHARAQLPHIVSILEAIQAEAR